MKSRVIQTQSNDSMSSSPAARTCRRAAGTGPSAHDRARACRGCIRRHPMAVFFGLAFALTWVTVPLGAFMAAGPLIAALVVIGVTEGRAGLRELGSRMTKWRVGWKWYAAALLIPLGLVLGTGALNVAFGASDAAFAKLELSSLAFTFGLRLVVPVFAPIGEEPGWRGFALPRLQADHSPFVATLILGLVVAVWHVPLVFLSAEHFAPILLLADVARAPSSTRGCSTTPAAASS